MLAIKSKPKVSYSLISGADFNFKLVAGQLAGVAPLYPGFKEWLYFTFRPDFYRGLRSIILAVSEGELAGLSLLKRTTEENKICTFFVNPYFRENKVGTELMKWSLDHFNGNKTIISVSQEKEAELYPTLKNAGFEMSYSMPDYYRVGTKEVFYTVD